MIRRCVCCEKEYDYCPNCAKKKEQPAWMFSFCSEDCKNLFNIVSAYNAKRVNKADVVAYIAEHKLGKNYSAPVQKVLNSVQAEPEQETVFVRESTPIKEEVTETIFSTRDPVKESPYVETNYEPYTRSRKKKKRMNTGYRISHNTRDIQ